MSTFLKKDIRSILFVLNLTVSGFALAILIIGELNKAQKVGVTLAAIIALLSAVGLFIDISKKNKKRLE